MEPMTIARSERSDNFALALKTILDAVGDSAVDEIKFTPATHSSILATTWDELLGSGLIETLPTGEHILTGRGWTAAVISTGKINDPDFRLRVAKLFATLKSF